jgi:hypothetical protein
VPLFEFNSDQTLPVHLPQTANCWYVVTMNEPLRLEFETRLWEQGHALVAGVDETGRGCLAGPVVAAACVLPSGCDPLEGVRDSKLTTREERAQLVEYITERALAISVAAASRREIDRINIRSASVLAMQRALARLQSWDYALIDGPLPRYTLPPAVAAHTRHYMPAIEGSLEFQVIGETGAFWSLFRISADSSAVS